MKNLFFVIIVMLLLVGCSSETNTQNESNNKPDTTVAEDIQDVADDLKETGQEISDTLSETFNDILGEFASTESSEQNIVENVEETKEEKEEIEYIVATVDEMYEMLNDNALKAKKTYDGQYVEVTGYLGTIDSDGDYICLEEMNVAYSFNSVQCFIKNDEQLDYVLDMSSGKKYTVRVRITLVGEFLGYAGDIVEFVD